MMTIKTSNPFKKTEIVAKKLEDIWDLRSRFVVRYGNAEKFDEQFLEELNLTLDKLWEKLRND